MKIQLLCMKSPSHFRTKILHARSNLNEGNVEVKLKITQAKAITSMASINLSASSLSRHDGVNVPF